MGIKVLIITILVSLGAIAQNPLFRSSATFSNGFMKDEIRPIYIGGFLEYFPIKNVGIRGDGYFSITDGSDAKKFTSNHQVFAGINKYFDLGGNFQPYIGFQPGLAYFVPEDSVLRGNELVAAESSFNPLMSLNAGAVLWVSDYFNFFGELKYVKGSALGNSQVRYLDEIRISLGLGFHLSRK